MQSAGRGGGQGRVVLRQLCKRAAAWVPCGLLCAGLGLAPPALAASPEQADKPPATEVSAGGEIGGPTWSVYANTTVVLSGLIAGVPKSIREDGWRLKAGAGYWEYTRRQTVWISGVGEQRVDRRRRGSSGDLLIGYQAGLGPLTLKVFAGAAYANERHLMDGVDEGSPGQFAAARVLVESWLNLGPNAFAQLDAGWTSRLDAINARGRLGLRITPEISIGPELGYWSAGRESGSGRDDLVRTGAFVRYEWAAGEVSLSGGVADGDAYGTLNALLRF